MGGALLQDIRYGFRLLLKSPAVTVVTVLTLALGIGGNAAIFSVIHAVLLRQLPYGEPDRVVMIWQDASRIGFPRATPSPADYADWKAQNSVFEDMALVVWRSANLTGDGPPERVSTGAISANLFPLLGVQPFRGRLFRPEEDAPEAPKVALVSYSLWQRRYGGEAGLVGRAIDLNDEKVLVVGVMPPRFQFLAKDIDLWAPAALPAREMANRGSHYLNVVARLKAGVSLAQARAEMDTIAHRIATAHPVEARDLRVILVPLREQLAGNVRLTLIMLLSAVAGVLLIACANVANLLLARGAARRREMALRAALGAGRSRLLRQLLTESLVLAGLGGVSGLLVASWSLTLLERLIPAGMATMASLQIDARVLGFASLVTLLAGVTFGLAPGLAASKLDLNEALKLGGGRVAGGSDRRLRSGLVVAETALALILLNCSILMIRTFAQLRGVDPGFRSENVLTLRTPVPPAYGALAKRSAFYREVLERISRLPGVVAAGYTTALPLTFKGGTRGFNIEGRTRRPGQDALYRQVTPGYLAAMGIALRDGRGIEDRDGPEAPLVAVINETMARKFWPGESAIGKRFRGDVLAPDRWITIVGIAADVKEMGLEAPAKAEFYMPCWQDVTFSYAPSDLVIRTASKPEGLAAAVRGEIWTANPQQPISNVRTMDEILDGEVLQRRTQMSLLGIFAGLALLLAALGIYSVLSYVVTRRTQEIGVRMALGAGRREVLLKILGDTLGLAVAGVAIGLAGALGATKLVESLLFGVRAWDPLTFAAAAGILLLVALGACYLPARRAARIDPMVALRWE